MENPEARQIAETLNKNEHLGLVLSLPHGEPRLSENPDFEPYTRLPLAVLAKAYLALEARCAGALSQVEHLQKYGEGKGEAWLLSGIEHIAIELRAGD